MAEEAISLFLKWVRRHGATSERTRTLLTLATLVSDDERLLSFRRELPAGWLDETFVEELASVAEPGELVALFASGIAPYTSAELFAKTFERILATSPDIEMLSALMFVAALFLQFHPGVLQLPQDVAQRLLASEDLDHRLAGLRALRHTTASTTQIIAEVTRALKRDDWQERRIALTQLGQLLEERGSQVAALSQQRALDELHGALAEIVRIALDSGTRDTASHHSAWLASLSEEA